MSVHVLSWVLRESEATLGDRLVLLVLADHAKEDGTSAWPSVETISQQSRLTRRQAQRCLRNLEHTGLILATGKSRTGTTVYTIAGYARGDNITPRGATNHTRGGVILTPDPSLVQPSVVLNGKPRPRNEIWDTLTHMFGEPQTPSATTARGKVCAELKAAGAQPEEILARGRNWPSHFDNATLTEHALVKHWHTLARKPLRRRS